MGLTKSVYTMHHVQSERPQHIRKWPNAPGIARVILTPSALWYKNIAFAYRTRKGRPAEIFQNRLQGRARHTGCDALSSVRIRSDYW